MCLLVAYPLHIRCISVAYPLHAAWHEALDPSARHLGPIRRGEELGF